MDSYNKRTWTSDCLKKKQGGPLFVYCVLKKKSVQNTEYCLLLCVWKKKSEAKIHGVCCVLCI